MSQQPVESAGLGVGISIDDDITTDQVWAALEIKVLRPDQFLPVTDVVTRPTDDGKGTYREMTTAFNSVNGLPERRIIENIYCLKDQLEVLFVVIDDKNEHVNAIITTADGKRTLDFFLRDAVTKERVEWSYAPKKLVLGGIQVTMTYTYIFTRFCKLTAFNS